MELLNERFSLLTVNFIGFVILSTIVDSVAFEILGNAEMRVVTMEIRTRIRLLDFGPNSLETLGSNCFVGNEETKNKF